MFRAFGIPHPLCRASSFYLMATRLFPTNIQQIGEELAIAWSDGEESFLTLETLRRGCPCAICGGEPDVMGYLERPEVKYQESSMRMRNWQFVGGYAVQPTWEDGHGSGIYSFAYLRRLAGAPPEVVKTESHS